MKRKPTHSTRYRLDPLLREIANASGAPCLFDPRNGALFGLNATSQLLVASLRQGATEDDLRSNLMREGATDADEARRDVTTFLTVMKEQGLVQS